MPQNWRIAIICPIRKKEGKMQCSNYTGISLLNVCFKVSSNVLKRLLVPLCRGNFRRLLAWFWERTINSWLFIL